MALPVSKAMLEQQRTKLRRALRRELYLFAIASVVLSLLYLYAQRGLPFTKSGVLTCLWLLSCYIGGDALALWSVQRQLR